MPISDRLNTTAIVNRKSRSSDGRGGNTYTYATHIASISCRISVKSNTERFLGDQVDDKASHVIFIAVGSDIKPQDQFVDGSDTYTITGVRKPSRGAHIELDAELINKPS